MEARARKAVVERDMAAKKLDDVVFPNVQPPPMVTQLQNLGGASAIVVGAFCELALDKVERRKPLQRIAGPLEITPSAQKAYIRHESGV
jgi:hypothetical protein